ncbi:multidrug ABC transporter ATPase/permease [Streptococcus gallolyticus]|uniref:Multidrug ABC transporter ATPase/permease n=1 Tax=Streptococcus gallolyticus TaxID=315405 RepID=A0AA94M0A5_9STRE|nr:ABC transporter ATP-binding protein [Streptococcus gallolyticus]AQP41118.1 ABC transporter [Streptococcus gallolyticus subsp. gallolyticus DSM 16831]SQG78397.1 multidrug ABC transporter ATPase/permease [Streptococcus gallolyticus]
MFFYIRQRYKENFFLLLIILFSVIIQLKAAFLTADAFNSLISGNTRLFVFKVILCAILYLIYTIIFAFKSWYEIYVRQKILSDIRKNITDAYAKHHPDNNSDYASGKMISWLTTDISRIESEGYQNFYNIVEAIINVTFSIVALFFVNWMLMLAIIVLAIVNLILPKAVDKRMASSFKNLTLQQEHFTANISNLYEGFNHLFSLNKQSFLLSQSNKEIDTICNTEITSYKIVGVATFFAALGNVLGQIGSLIISGVFVAQKLLTFGDILSVSTISVNIFNGVSNLSSSIISIKGVFPIFEKHTNFFERIQKEIVDENQKLSTIHFNSQLTLKNVGLSFDKHTILSDANYEFQKRKKYCIVGPSGSGKSTLFKLLNGSLNCDSGTIELDNHSLKDINGSSLRSQITCIEQFPYIFNGTIRENLLLDNDFSDEEIDTIIHKVGLSNEIKQLPKGLDTVVGENDLNLSGGQKQRLSLARAILNGSHFLLLDESTSSLNAKLAQSIEKELLSDKNYSIISITHHLSEEMIPYFDDILELKNGKLISQKKPI